MIEFKCSQCGNQLRVKDEADGKKGKCPQCGKTLLVPEQETVTLEAVELPSAPPPPSHANAHPSDGGLQPAPLTKPTNQKHRRWVVLLLVGALVASPFAPKFPLWFGIALLVLCVVAFIPGVQGFSRRLLRLNPGEKWRCGLRLAMYGLIGLVLIIAGGTGAEYKAEQGRVAAKQAEEEAEQQRLANEANAEVIALVREAEVAWQSGKVALADEKLASADKIPHATDLAPLRQLRARMANAEVQSLMAEAIKAVKLGDVDTAKKKVQAALVVPHANALANARRLDKQIGNATDPNRIRETLMGLSDEAFTQLQESGQMPSQLISGYEGLDSRTVDLAKAQLADVAAAREQRRLEKLARARAEAEAGRKAEEERKDRELAAAARAKAKAEIAEKARLDKGMGETLTIGYTSYVVWRAHWSDRLSSNQFLNKRPNAKWLFLQVSVRNNDKKARTIPPFKLVDEQGREYESSSDAMMIENAIGILDSLNPDVTKQGYVVFDVPSSRTYKLKLSGGYWSTETGYIRIKPKAEQ